MHRRSCVVVALLLLAGPVLGDGRVDDLIAQLRDKDAAVREEAADRLKQLGVAKLGPLENALKDEKLTADQRKAIETAIEAINGKADRDAVRRGRAKAKIAWWHSIATEAYNEVGKHDPKWDKHARGALNTWEWAMGQVPFYYEDMTQETWNGAKSANLAGCDDPLLEYVYGWCEKRINGGRNPEMISMVKAARQMTQSKYGPYIKANALLEAAQGSRHPNVEQTPELEKERKQWIADAFDLLPEVAKDDRMPIEAFALLMRRAGNAADENEAERVAVYDKAYAIMEKAGAPKSDLLSARGEFYIEVAFDTRGEAKKAWLKRAEADALESWKLDDKNPRTAWVMMSVCLGEMRPRQEMDTWFGRMMEADPDATNACTTMLRYLDAQGNIDSVLEFGRSCLASGNFEGGIPMAMLEAQQFAAGEAADTDAYFKDPKVWEEARAVLQPMMRRHKWSKYVRSYYLWYAVRCDQWAEVDRLLPEFEEKASWSYWFYTKEGIADIREKAAARHGAATQPAN